MEKVQWRLAEKSMAAARGRENSESIYFIFLYNLSPCMIII
jgi:hypothetical protein